MLPHVLMDPFFWVAIAGLLVSSVASILPEPEPKDGKAYLAFYRMVHLVAANWDKVGVVLEKCAEQNSTQTMRGEATAISIK